MRATLIAFATLAGCAPPTDPVPLVLPSSAIATDASAPPAPPPPVPPAPVPPPPPEPSAEFLALPERPLTPTGDRRLDAFIARVVEEGGPEWRPLLLRAFNGVGANAAAIAALESDEPASPAAHVARYVTAARIQRGQRLYAQLNGTRLFEGEQKVPTEYLLALWGILSDYGSNPPPFDMIEAIANAAAHGYEPAWSEFQIYHAVRILAEGRASRSMARAYGNGRIGQVRWLPTQYYDWGEDGDGDGRINIWTNRADILRNLHRALSAWEPGIPPVVEVERREFDLSDPLQRRYAESFDQMKSSGNLPARMLRRADGRPWPADANRWSGSFVEPFGSDGPAYFLTYNFTALNYASPFRSRYGDAPDPGFGLAVAFLAERIAGRRELRLPSL